MSFPAATTQTPDPSGNVHLTIQLPTQSAPASAAPREVVLTYVTDSPAWKPSYRVVVEPSGKVGLQGWAIVDNTSGEDWRAVRVGVGASSALSFRYDLHSIRSVHRETLRTEDSFAKAPPRGGSIYREDGQRYTPAKFSVRGRDLATTIDDAQATVARDVRRVLDEFKAGIPKGSNVVLLGQVRTMERPLPATQRAEPRPKPPPKPCWMRGIWNLPAAPKRGSTARWPCSTTLTPCLPSWCKPTPP